MKVIDEISLVDDLSKHLCSFPNPNSEVVPGIMWGLYGKLFTPAYWKAQYLLHSSPGLFAVHFKLGENILDEVVACILGGFGTRSEIGLAAYNRLKERKLIRNKVPYQLIHEALTEPYLINNKPIHYRFPNQRAKFIYQFLERDDLDNIPLQNDIDLRKWLVCNNGIGPKTASWITRNFLNSDKVAIIDVHIFRALLLMGFYTRDYEIQRDYIKLEQIFIGFCHAIDVQPSKMDSLMWLQMKESNRMAIKVLSNA